MDLKGCYADWNFGITPQNERLGGRVPSDDVTAELMNVFRIINSWVSKL